MQEENPLDWYVNGDAAPGEGLILWYRANDPQRLKNGRIRPA